MIKTPVSRVKHQIMLLNDGCNPDVVRRNRSTLLAQLPKNSSEMEGCLFVRKEADYARTVQKCIQYALIATR